MPHALRPKSQNIKQKQYCNKFNEDLRKNGPYEKEKKTYKKLKDALGSGCMLSLVTPWTVARQAPLSMGFSRQEYWSRLPFPPPRDLPDPGTEPGSPAL